MWRTKVILNFQKISITTEDILKKTYVSLKTFSFLQKLFRGFHTFGKLYMYIYIYIGCSTQVGENLRSNSR